MANSRKARGMATQRMVADYWRDLFPFATSTAAGAPGPDIQHTGALAFEVKARRAFDPSAWMRQARTNAASSLAVVVMRPDGAGITTIGDWPLFLRQADAKMLILKAGYHENA